MNRRSFVTKALAGLAVVPLLRRFAAKREAIVFHEAKVDRWREYMSRVQIARGLSIECFG